MIMHHKLAITWAAAALMGFVAPHLLAAAWAALADYVDPGSRLAGFLLASPRHPLQLAVAALALHLGAGVTAGALVGALARRHRANAWIVGLFFVLGFVASVALVAGSRGSLNDAMAWLWSTRIALFFVAAAATIKLWQFRASVRMR
jgi:hypothetical protein